MPYASIYEDVLAQIDVEFVVLGIDARDRLKAMMKLIRQEGVEQGMLLGAHMSVPVMDLGSSVELDDVTPTDEAKVEDWGTSAGIVEAI